MCYSSFGKVPEIQRAEWRVQGGMKRGIESSDEESNLNSASSIYEYDDMTPHQKKIKMAKEYIEELKNNMEEEEVEETLQKEIEEVKFEKLAEFYDIFEDGNFSRINAIPTSIASTDEMTFLGCDNGDLWIYGVGYKCKMAFDSSVTLTTSPNNKFLVVGCDKTISLYEIKSFSIDAVNGKRKYIDSEEVLRLLKSLNGHRKRVTFLEFDLDSSVLYSVSNDRSLKVWSIKYSGANQVNDSGYVDTLFGHQDVISGMALLTKGKPITVGNRDKTTRVFNVANSSQMVYRVPHDSDACSSIAVINQRHFVVGTLSGQLLLFNSQKKRPIHTRHNAHSQNIMSTICGDISVSNPISHVVTIPFTDVVVSSSHNQVIMWKCDLDSNSFSMLKSIQMPSYVTCLSLSNNQLFVGCGIHEQDGRYLDPLIKSSDIQINGNKRNMLYKFNLRNK